MWFQAELRQLRVHRIVVVLLGLHAWIRQVIDDHRQAGATSSRFDALSQVHDRKLFCELIEYSKFTGSCRMVHRQSDTLDRVAYVQKSAGLPTFSINCEWLS